MIPRPQTQHEYFMYICSVFESGGEWIKFIDRPRFSWCDTSCYVRLVNDAAPRFNVVFNAMLKIYEANKFYQSVSGVLLPPILNYGNVQEEINEGLFYNELRPQQLDKAFIKKYK